MSVFIKTEIGWRPFYKGCVNSNDLQGVFQATSLEQSRMVTMKHADHYVACVGRYVAGGYPGTGEARLAAMWRDINSFKMTGAYGEKL